MTALMQLFSSPVAPVAITFLIVAVSAIITMVVAASEPDAYKVALKERAAKNRANSTSATVEA